MSQSLQVLMQSLLIAGWTLYVAALFLRSIDRTRTDP
jgi:hypothetical protein